MEVRTEDVVDEDAVDERATDIGNAVAVSDGRPAERRDPRPEGGAAAEAEAVRVELITSQGNDANHDAEKIERIRELASE